MASESFVTEGTTGERVAALLVNSKSRRGQEWYEQAKDKLHEKGFNLVVAKSYTKADDMFAEAKSLLGKVPTIIAGGGDGSISAMANICAKKDVVLGVLPLGTGNAFARDLGIAANVDEAVEVIVNGKIAEVDLGVYSDGYFVNVATIGLTTQIAEALTVPMKRKFGRFVYAYALVKALKDIEPFHVKIETENGTIETTAIQVVVGNGKYHAGPFPLGPTAHITSGSQHIYVVEGTTKASLLLYAMALPTGYQGLLKEVHAEDSTGGTITTIPSLPVIVDGEIGPKTPLKFAVAPKALKVYVPESFSG